jgi:hypothetical protein
MGQRKVKSRRQFLRETGLGLAALPFASPVHAQNRQSVSVRLDWIYQGPNAG